MAGKPDLGIPSGYFPTRQQQICSPKWALLPHLWAPRKPSWSAPAVAPAGEPGPGPGPLGRWGSFPRVTSPRASRVDSVHPQPGRPSSYQTINPNIKAPLPPSPRLDSRARTPTTSIPSFSRRPSLPIDRHEGEHQEAQHLDFLHGSYVLGQRPNDTHFVFNYNHFVSINGIHFVFNDDVFNVVVTPPSSSKKNDLFVIAVATTATPTWTSTRTYVRVTTRGRRFHCRRPHCRDRRPPPPTTSLPTTRLGGHRCGC